jgi:hypothetical protein
MNTLDHLTTVQLNGEAVAVYRPADRRGSALVTVTAPVTLTLDEVAAALFIFTWESAQPVDDLADDDRIRVLVAEGVVNWGCEELDEIYRNVMAAVAASEAAAELLAHCRYRATAVFAPTGAPVCSPVIEAVDSQDDLTP